MGVNLGQDAQGSKFAQNKRLSSQVNKDFYKSKLVQDLKIFG